MSFILDALRKSESRRKRSQIPDLDSPEPSPPPRPRRRRLLWPLTGVAVLALTAAGAFWLMPAGWLPGAGPSPANEPVAAGPDDRESGRQPQMNAGAEPGERELASSAPRESTSGTETGTETQASAGEDARTIRPREQRESAPVDAEAATRELEQRMAEAQRRAEEARRKAAAEQQARAARDESAASAETSPRPRVEAAEPAGRTAADASAGRVAPSAGERRRERTQAGVREPAARADADDAEAVADDSPSAQLPDYVRAWELPLSVRRKLPDLALTMHVFSPRPEERFVLINGERHTAGDVVGGSVELVEIRREGAIMDFDSHRFLLEPR